MQPVEPPLPKKTTKHSLMSDTDSSADSDQLEKSWIDSFLELPSSDWFCRVPSQFTADGFNTCGILNDESHAKIAFKQLLAQGEDSDSFDSDSEDEIEKCTEVIFGLIHARYIFTEEGSREMIQKYTAGVFGICPRSLCGGHLLPIGMTDRRGVDTVKCYCPDCREIYRADDRHSALDGAYFTRSFAHYMLLELSKMKGDAGDVAAGGTTSESTTGAK